MIKLIKNELIKIFSKKSLYIILIVIFGIIFYQTFSYEKRIETQSSSAQSSLREELDFTKEQMSLEDKSTYSGLLNYVKLQSRYDLIKMIGNLYGDESWQASVIMQNYKYMAYDMYYDYYLMNNLEKYFNESTFELEDSDKVSKKESIEKYNKINEVFSKNDWKVYADMQLEEFQKEKQDLEKQLEKEYDSLTEDSIESLNYDIEELNIRLKENIPMDYSYFSKAVSNYISQTMSLELFKPNRFSSYNEYTSRQYYKNSAAVSKYDYENRIKTDYTNDTRYKLSITFENHAQQIFIIVLIIYFSAGIVSSEINKGTIKQLLSKPHSRFKILLSKFITTLIMIILSALVVVLMVLISNLIIKHDIKSLLTPITLYNYNTDTLMVMGIGKYLIIQFLAKLPMFISIATLSFAISTLFNNQVLASIIPLCLYIANLLIITPTEENILFTRNLLTTNWDLAEVYFGRLAHVPSLSLEFCLIICIFYILILLIPSFLYFCTSDIKNK